MFLTNLQPEWRRFTISIRQNQDLTKIDINNIFDHLKHNQENNICYNPHSKVTNFPPEESDSTSQELALILQNMALFETRIQKRCYSKPTNNNIWITSAPTAQYKRQDYLPRNEMNDLYVDTDDEGEQLEANVVFMARLEKIEAFEAKHVGTTEASGDDTQLNEAFLNKVKMDNPNITMEEYIRLEEEKARRRAIAFNDTLTSEATLSCEPTVSSLNDEIDFRISIDKSDDEDCTHSLYDTLIEYNIYKYQYGVSWGMDTAYRLPVQF
ncbi:hypothetical protein Tco_0915371 [Tanacetum coccineum]